MREVKTGTNSKDLDRKQEMSQESEEGLLDQIGKLEIEKMRIESLYNKLKISGEKIEKQIDEKEKENAALKESLYRMTSDFEIEKERISFLSNKVEVRNRINTSNYN